MKSITKIETRVFFPDFHEVSFSCPGADSYELITEIVNLLVHEFGVTWKQEYLDGPTPCVVCDIGLTQVVAVLDAWSGVFVYSKDKTLICNIKKAVESKSTEAA